MTLDNLNEAYAKYWHLNPIDTVIDCVVDGGSENNNIMINNWHPIVSGEIRKLIAQSENFRFSNSMAESTNRIMKYVYLYKQDLEDFNAVKNFLEFAVTDNNENRCHNRLNGLTPKEVFYGKIFDKDNHHKKIFKANQIRLERNRKTPCPVCDDENKITEISGLIK